MLVRAASTDLDPGVTLRDAAAGDGEAFAAIVREHQAMVYSLATHVLRDGTLAEDVAQDVFLDLYRYLARIRSPAHLLFWLRRVAIHRALDAARRRGSWRVVPFDEARERAHVPGQEDPFVRRRLARLLAGLPPKTRALLVLRYQEDLEPGEIAALLGMRVNTVKSQLQRALKTLRRDWPVESE
jgi:RNA polymerase sigma-70 factor (ECF subfamily)